MRQFFGLYAKDCPDEDKGYGCKTGAKKLVTKFHAYAIQPSYSLDVFAAAKPTHSETLVCGVLFSVSGFVLQFFGLRGIHWAAILAQLGTTLIMTGVRAVVRRCLSKTPIVHEHVLGASELDWLAIYLY